ncbi:hypothetical protein BBOV_II006370 [Babesia bovis T2Bo]|uniref:Uncharacterized protein n=2 Tax=Babesia bovis TaxID=5865 RepID=A7AUH6_BABBO|nr:hypothetical protein BBOV_II006370 [Babesia bovis T2Bo]EDO06587.1 hypothetical protein BBOV_II006370 [Babesia bovis T2Bo]|eukprot:XP_001610155.1 hypothetical protein [Babesia bovis T2Bo]
MECIIQAVVEEPSGANTEYIRLYDARKRHLGMPVRIKWTFSQGFRAIARAFLPIESIWDNMVQLFESYYLAAERPALLDMQTTLNALVQSILTGLKYTYRLCRCTSSRYRRAIASISLDNATELGTKKIVFKYGYFGHGLDIKVGMKSNGVLIAEALDQGSINVSYEKVVHRGLLQLTRAYETPMETTSHALGFDNGHADANRFITCVSMDPMPCFGSTILLCYSTGEAEIWKESVSMTELREALCEAVAQCKLQGYPFYCAFSPAGELAVVLTTENMYIMEWNGSALTGIKLVNGTSADIWTRPTSNVLAAEWLNIHEILSLTDHGELWLSRRGEMGYWQRITQYILRESLPQDVGITTWISRMQYDTRGLLYLKMYGTDQLLQLKWDKTPLPELISVELPPRESGTRLKTNAQKSDSVPVADFAIEQHSSIMAVVISDRSMVYVYTYPNPKFMHAVGPPKPHLKVGGLKFVTAGNNTNPNAYLAIKWVEIGIETFKQRHDYDIDHRIERKHEQCARVTVLYAINTIHTPQKDWSEQSLADILSESDVTMYPIKHKQTFLRRHGLGVPEPVPRLSVFRPNFPDKIPGGTQNNVMFRDAFAQRRHIFNKHATNTDLGTTGISQRSLDKDLHPETPVYSMEEFARRKRATF